ncbi:MAG: single-stranded-DNA-specific exonuclease RecJ [Rhizobiaceae bacterium]
MSDGQRNFLDVRQSAKGMAWRQRLLPQQENAALAIAQSHDIPDLIARVMAARGVEQDQADRFLEPTIRDLLPDPSTLTDMDVAAGRIAKAIADNERVAIFGDYDVDGAASSALLKRFFAHFGIDAEIYIPDRIFEGYGPNPDAMRDLASRASLIITVDCGTTSAEAITAGLEAGSDVVVLDHHQVGEGYPHGIPVVNPNRDDDMSGQGHLCAAGVVFLTLVRVSALQRQSGQSPPDLLGLLDLVALATVCDVVPLQGVNRAFVTRGLLVARAQSNPGMAALARAARIGEPLAPFHLGFAIGPRINAGGRIGDAALGSRLLATDDPVEAQEIAATLDRLNAERQAMEQSMLAEAMAQAEAELARGDGPAVLIAESETWHPGVVGILASRLKDNIRRPAFAIAFNKNGMGTGSGRSISGIDLGKLVRGALEAGLSLKGGGHAMAAGITVERSRLGEFRSWLEEQAGEAVAEARRDETLKIDGALSADGATLELIELLEKAGPYGAGHPQPVFAMPHHLVADVRMVGTNHLRISLKSRTGGRLQAMAFRAADTDLGRMLGENRGSPLHIAGTLGANTWNGRTTPQLRIIDAAVPERV